MAVKIKYTEREKEIIRAYNITLKKYEDKIKELELMIFLNDTIVNEFLKKYIKKIKIYRNEN